MKKAVLRLLEEYDRYTGHLDRGVQLIMAAGMLVMFGLLLLSVLSRYVINRPFFWLAEGAGYIMALVGVWGSSSCLRHSGHMQVNYLQDKFRKLDARAAALVSPIFVIITNGLLLFYCYFIVTAGYRFAEFGRFESSASGFFIVFWPRLVLPIGFLLIGLQSLNLIGHAIRRLMGETESSPT